MRWKIDGVAGFRIRDVQTSFIHNVLVSLVIGAFLVGLAGMRSLKVIKTAVLVVSVLLLSGCVYYTPYPEPTYAGSEESGDYYEQTYDTSDVCCSSYHYPWWSMDYFYLGNHYYHPGSSISFSFSYGGYPWYSPYYGYYPYSNYYSSWYRPYYGYPYYDPRFSWGAGFGYGYGWQDPYWYHRYRGHDHYRYGRNHDRGYGGHGNGVPQPVDRSGGRYANRYDQVGEVQQMPINRRVSVAPAGTSSDRGMVVVNRSDGKLRQNRVQPVTRQEGSGTVTVPVPQPGASSQAVQPGQMRVVQPNRPSNIPSQSAAGFENRAPGRAPDASGRSRGGGRESRGERGSRDDR